MVLEEYIEIGFRGEPTEKELKEISEIIDKTLKTINVEKYELGGKIKDFRYYNFSLEETKKTNMTPKTLLNIFIHPLSEELQSTYDNVKYVGFGPGKVELLKATV